MHNSISSISRHLIAYFLIIHYSASLIPCVKAQNANSSKWIIYNSYNSMLPNNNVLSITIDEEGNKWIGTDFGLTRFDGKNWIVYNKKNCRMNDTSVRSIAIDPSGDIWTATPEDGAPKLLISESSIMYNSGLPFYKYTIEDRTFNPDKISSLAKWIFYRMRNSPLPSNSVKTIHVDDSGTKWFGTDQGLVKLSSTSWGSGSEGGLKWLVYDTINSGLPCNIINSITSDQYGNLWIGTFGGGLVKYDGTFWTVYNIRNSGLPDDYIISIAIDQKDNIWIGTYSGGLAKFEGTNLPKESRGWVVYKTSNSGIPDNNVISIAIDNDGSVWTGSFDSGLAQLDRNKWISYQISGTGISYAVTSIAIDKKGNIWMGTNFGLAVFNENGVKF
ncbi:MAG: two-component regulator propeller domain-containing protein [Bacteroidota bacterium]